MKHLRYDPDEILDQIDDAHETMLEAMLILHTDIIAEFGAEIAKLDETLAHCREKLLDNPSEEAVAFMKGGFGPW